MPALDLHAARPRRSAAGAARPRPPEQVVGLVGDGEVGVAGDPEDVVVEDLHPGKSASRWSAMTSSIGTNVSALATGTKRGNISFGTFTRAKVVWPVTGSRTSTAERQRQVGDVRERAARGRRPAASAPGRSGAGSALERAPLLVARRRRGRDADAVLGQRRQQLVRRGSASGARRARPRARGSRRSSRRRAPVRQPRAHTGLDLVLQAGDADHEELVEVRGVDRAELHALQQGPVVSSTSCRTRSLKMLLWTRSITSNSATALARSS